MHLRRRIATTSIILIITLGATCAPPPATVIPIAELEPNNTIATAQSLAVINNEILNLTGTLDPSEDVDLFSIGALNAGDQITITTQAGTNLSLNVVIFEVQSDQLLATLFAAAQFPLNDSQNSIDQVIHHSGNYTFGITRVFGSLDVGMSYDLAISIVRGNPAPVAQTQKLFLDFNGGTTLAPNGQEVAISAFDAAAIDPVYAGQTQSIKDAIIETVRQNFDSFNVEIFDSDHHAPPASPFSTVFFGTVDASAAALASEGFGAALDGVDLFNQDHSDDAIVFVQNFSPATFGVDTPLDAASLSTTIGNVAAHEAGHLLGLQHSFDPSDIMNTFDAPTTLLLDQRFKRSLIHFSIFDPLYNALTQDAPLLLAETVGRTQLGPDLTLPVGTTPFAVTTADFDNDGSVDMAVANLGSNDISLFFNQGNRSFFADYLYLGAGPIALTAFQADFGNSVDLITANPGDQTLSLLFNDGIGIFSFPFTLSAGDLPRAVAAADFNHDGTTDLAVTNYGSEDVSILLNNGFGFFTLVTNLPVGSSPQGITAADLNGDNHPDLAVANFQSNDISILLNTGNATFAPAISLPVGVLPISIVAADLDNDGDNDLAVTNLLSSFSIVQFGSDISILLNNGDGTFTSTFPVFVGPAPESITAADIDNDNDIDLVVATNGDSAVETDSGSISVLYNNGDGTFAQDRLLIADATPSSVALAHLDNDGLIDLVVVNRDSNNISIFFNRGGFR